MKAGRSKTGGTLAHDNFSRSANVHYLFENTELILGYKISTLGLINHLRR